MRFVPRLLAIALTGLAGICPAAGETLAIRNVTVINPQSRTVHRNQTVIVEGRQIQTVQAVDQKLAPRIRIVEGTGKFLIPGLWDAHVHLTKAGILSLPLFVANGVTSVRDMGSDFAEVEDWRKQIEAGTLQGPSIKTSGQILESRSNIERMKREHTVEPVDRIRIGIGNPEEGRAAVRRLAKMGVDHIKMRTTPDLATFEAVADEAARHHLPLAAHPVATPQQMMRAKLRSVEHLLAFPPLNTLSAAERRSLFQAMKNSGMFMSDTAVNLWRSVLLSYAEAKLRLNNVSGKIDPYRKYVCGYLVDDWREQVEEKKGEENAIETFRKEMPGILRDLRGMREANVPFLAGTDVAVAFMYPGFSLHDELEAEVHDLGFSPMEALRNATYSPHTFYRDTQEQGAIAKGQAADLVLLNGDPLSDISNTRLIEGVMVRGEWLDRAALDGLLARTVQQAKGDCGTGGREKR